MAKPSEKMCTLTGFKIIRYSWYKFERFEHLMEILMICVEHSLPYVMNSYVAKGENLYSRFPTSLVAIQKLDEGLMFLI